MTLYIGLMSGTSLDGTDGVLVAFDRSDREPMQVIAHAHQPFAPALKAEFLALNASGPNELHRAALAGNALARTYVEVVARLLEGSKTPADSVQAIGAHGQ